MICSLSLAICHYSIEARTRKCIQGYGFFSLARNLSNKYGKHFLDTATRTRLDALKTTSKKVVHKAAEGTGEFIGNKIAGKIVKPKPLPAENSRNVEEIIVPPGKRVLKFIVLKGEITVEGKNENN